jgi:hypothetical protein
MLLIGSDACGSNAPVQWFEYYAPEGVRKYSAHGLDVEETKDKVEVRIFDWEFSESPIALKEISGKVTSIIGFDSSIYGASFEGLFKLEKLEIMKAPISFDRVREIGRLLIHPECVIADLTVCLMAPTFSSINLLGKALLENKSLRHLKLINNSSESEIWDDGIIALASGIKKHPSLQKLNIQNMGMTDRGLETLTLALNNHPSMEDLNLAGNPLSDLGGHMIAQMFESGSKIKRLNVRRTGLKVNGINWIGISLQSKADGEFDTLCFGPFSQEDGNNLVKTLSNFNPWINWDIFIDPKL